MNKKTNKLKQIAILLLFIIIIATGYNNGEGNQTDNIIENNKISYEISDIPEYNKEAYVEINNNNPKFTTQDMNLENDYYSTLQDGKVRNGNDKNLLGKGQ